MRHLSFTLALTLGLLCGCATPCRKAEKYSLRNVYGDHMVLQRGVPIRIAGFAEPGTSVKVTLAGKANAETYATADHQGSWVALLPAQPAGGPYTVTVSGAPKSKPIVLSDVLMGDVWFCSGQSNMEMPVWGKSPLYREENGDKIAKQANHPQLRLFKVGKGIIYEGPMSNLQLPGVWQSAATPKAVESFSATGYFFGLALQKELNVPVGLIDASWGGTMIQPWIPGAAYLKANRREAAQILAEQQKGDTENWRNVKKLSLKAWLAAAEKEAAPDLAERVKTWTLQNVPADGWEKVRDGNLFIVDHLGSAWFRAEFDLPPSFDTADARLHVGAIDDCDDTFVANEEQWTAMVAYYIDEHMERFGQIEN